ncbi:MAG: energy-coupling factor transporter ATPase [Candidatus Muiribacterium halophilum]|mgnify:CR=1 FL=1|uniref:Energy-coupling factor transporter ATPase n=1 Tax=Muiribacterium halophilum TaxID=2053465 RepID=A0A2N5ZJF3_MUIH1|nr:MAG: energy-coupling factor transporter ATPase [Candidatus Muirbacterium halophilum]
MIEFKKVDFKYPGQNKVSGRVLSNIDLRMEKGSFYSIVGHNGSGKSTLAKLITGILTPEKGEIFVDGLPVLEENFISIRRMVGYIFQNPENQLISTTVENEIAFALENLCFKREDIKEKVDDIISWFELEEYRNTPPNMLSGGQKQRLAIASVVVMEPEYIIFDEPTAMLDKNGREEVFKTIKKLSEHGKTIILISHDLKEIIAADHVITMQDGKVSGIWKKEEFFSSIDLITQAGFKDLPPEILFSKYITGNESPVDYIIKEVSNQ